MTGFSLAFFTFARAWLRFGSPTGDDDVLRQLLDTGRGFGAHVLCAELEELLHRVLALEHLQNMLSVAHRDRQRN